MAKYKYIVEQAKRFDDNANDRKVIDMWHVVGHDMEDDWDTAISTEPGDEEFNAKVVGDEIDDSSDLGITGGQFTIYNGDKTATVYLDGDEQNLVDIMDKIDDAFQVVEMPMTVKAFTVRWPGENKSYLEIVSTGTPGTSDEITIATTTANLSQFGLEAGTTNGTKPDVTIVNKIYLGGVIPSSEEINNPMKPEIIITDKYDHDEMGRLFRAKKIQNGFVEDDSVPLTATKWSYPYVETEFDESEDGAPEEDLLFDSTGHHLFKVANVCKEFDSTTNECVSWRYEPVATSSDERAAEDDYANKYISLIIGRSIEFGNELIREFTSENVQMGITASGQTNAVRKALAESWQAIQTGSLHDAIYELEQVVRTSPFLTEARLRAFINRIKDYLGISY